MTKSNSTAYLITGASRGIGKELVKTLLVRPDTIVVATLRNINSPEAKKLNALTVGRDSHLYLIEMEMSEPDSILKAITTLHIDKLDVVISNAAIAQLQKSVAEVPVEDMLTHYKVNVIGSLVLYQATKMLLQKSSNPKFIFMSSVAGSVGIQAQFPFNNTPYSISKAAVNVIGTRLAFEEKGKIIVLLLHPGVVETGMIEKSKERGLDMEQTLKELGVQLLTTKESAQYLLKHIDDATHEDSGKFIDVTTGDIVPW